MEEKVLCCICNSDSTKLLYIKDDIPLVRCNHCGLVYVNPRSEPTILHKQYHESSYFDYYEQMEESDRQTFKSRLEKVEELVKPGRLLDVGCARGIFLQVAQKRGWEAVGVDISPAIVEHCQSRGLTVYCGDLPQINLEAESFDFINMEDSLEHIPNPKEMMTEVYRLLKPGGWLLVRTPDIGSILARVLGKHWIQVKPREHIYYFTAATLKKLLEPIGFSVEKTEKLGRVFYWELIATKLRHHSKLLGNILTYVLRKLRAEQKMVQINLGDEIGVWVSKRA